MRFTDISPRSLSEDVAALTEFQISDAVRWQRKNSEWVSTFTVGDQTFELHMMDALLASPKSGEEAGGVDVAFGRVRMRQGRGDMMDVTNTHDSGTSARAVFSKVLSGVIDYCRRNDPQFIEFKANVSDGRSKLYRAIYAYLAKNGKTYGYLAPEINDAGTLDDDHFILWHESELQDIHENATAGATSAASVATVPGGRGGKIGGLGVGFDPNGDQGIYAGKPKEKKSGDGVIRR